MDKKSQLEPYEKNMDSLFKELYEEFIESDFMKKKDLKTSCRGIYAFYENEKAIYVGRTNDIKKRINEHTRPGSGSEKASFAFNLAKKNFLIDNEKKMKRKDFMDKDDFRKIFEDHKSNLANLDLKFIAIDNDILQTMFEPYLANKLGTYPHNNTFENH